MWFEFDKKMEGNDYFILIDNVTHYNYVSELNNLFSVFDHILKWLPW